MKKKIVNLRKYHLILRRSYHVYKLVYLAYSLYNIRRQLPKELAKYVYTEHLVALNPA